MTALILVILLVNVFIIGVLTPMVVRHAKAHFSPQKPKAERESDNTPSIKIPAELKEHLVQNSAARFQAIMEQSAAKFEHDLQSTAGQIDSLVKRLAAEIVGNELERYREELTVLRKQAQVDIGTIKEEIDSHKSELKAGLEQEIAAEKQKLAEQMAVEKSKMTKQIDAKLSDAVISFLLEALGHNVDLGSQHAYLVSLLEEHKAEFVKEMEDKSEDVKETDDEAKSA